MTPYTLTRRIAHALAVAGVIGVVLFLTLGRIDVPPKGVQLWEWCFLCGAQWGIDFVLNILLFLPLGLTVRLVRVPPFPAWLAIAATSFFIEVLQLVIPGRITSIDDLAANTLGGIIGYQLGGTLRSIVVPTTRQAAAAAMGAGTMVMLVLWGTLWLFEPAPTRHPYWGQFSPWLGQFAFFGGTVHEASVGDQPLRNGRLRNTDAVREALSRDSVSVRAVASGGIATERLAPVVSIFDGEHNEVMVLGRSGRRSLTFRLRSRATVFGFRTPEVTVWNAFPAASGPDSAKRVRLSGTVHGYSISASARTDSSCVTRTIDFRHTQGWAYLLPFEHLLTPRAERFTTIWLAILFVPLGYYASARVVGRHSVLRALMMLLWIAIILALSLVALPLLAGLGAGTPGEWRGALVGVASGAIIGGVVTALLGSRDPRSVRYN